MTDKIPNSIGVIMDGNRRWAREQGLSILEGHRAGYKKLKEVAQWCEEVGIHFLIIYAFSNENWGRTEEEVANLMGIFRDVLMREVRELAERGVHIQFIGERERFSSELQSLMAEAERETNGGAFTLVVALSYGGRQEIIAAVNALLAQRKTSVDERTLTGMLWTAGIPDPDLIIRTGGERRLSNFLPWQSTYSELFFSPTMWPAFTKEEFLSILSDYAERDRRHGK